MKSIIVLMPAILMLGTLSAFAEEPDPLYLIISDYGNRIGTVKKDDGTSFNVMAEIGGCLNFSIRGDFKKAEIVKGTVLAPDGRTYLMAEHGEQPETGPGTLLKFLFIKYGDLYSKFSIGRWKVNIDYTVDGKQYTHTCDYLITWRDSKDGPWQNQRSVNESEESLKEHGIGPDGSPLNNEK